MNKQQEFLQLSRVDKKNELEEKAREEAWRLWFIKRQILDKDQQNGWHTLGDSTKAEAYYTSALEKDTKGNT